VYGDGVKSVSVGTGAGCCVVCDTTRLGEDGSATAEPGDLFPVPSGTPSTKLLATPTFMLHFRRCCGDTDDFPASRSTGIAADARTGSPTATSSTTCLRLSSSGTTGAGDVESTEGFTGGGAGGPRPAEPLKLGGFMPERTGFGGVSTTGTGTCSTASADSAGTLTTGELDFGDSIAVVDDTCRLSTVGDALGVTFRDAVLLTSRD
jgi:hypothetical protein